MRLLRLLALAAVLLVAYFAQYLFDHGSLSAFYPTWVLARLPFLQGTTIWLADDLHTLGLWLYVLAAILFGLLIPPLPPLTEAGDPAPARRHWIGLGVVLLATAGLLVWGGQALPARIDSQAARAGLDAQALLAGSANFWGISATGAPQIAYLPAAIATQVLGNALVGSQMAATIAGLLMVLATWLVGNELFAELKQGRGMAVVAAGVAATAVAFLYFGRQTPYLFATAVGTLGAWAFLRGERTHHRLTLLVAGVLAGLALTLDRSGLIFAPLCALWWLGLWVVGRRRPDDRERLNAPGMLVWLGGLALGALPALISWALTPAAFTAYLHGAWPVVSAPVLVDWWANLRHSVLAFFVLPDSSQAFGYEGPLIINILAPLFVVSIGALVLNLDRLVGWGLLTWIALVVLFSSLANQTTPDWRTLLPALPAAGLAICFALDRILALWSADEGVQSGSVGVSLAVGVLVAAGFFAWVGFYQVAQLNGDAASYTGRALRSLPEGATAVLVSQDPTQSVRLDDPVVQFAAGRHTRQALALRPEAVPTNLPAGSMLIVQPGDGPALDAARAKYPQAVEEVTRDLHGNPRLYVVRVQ